MIDELGHAAPFAISARSAIADRSQMLEHDEAPADRYQWSPRARVQ